MLRRVSSRELTEWMQYEQLEPFGEVRADMRAAIVASTIANVNRGKGVPAFKIADFMPKFWEEEPEEKTPEQQRAMVEMLARMFGARDERDQIVDPRGNPISSRTLQDRATRIQLEHLERERRAAEIRSGNAVLVPRDAPPGTDTRPRTSQNVSGGTSGGGGGIEIIAASESARKRLERIKQLEQQQQ